jgi:hypothetical protein
METEKMNTKLVQELNGVKDWMKFLDKKSNYNKSFHKSTTTGNPKLMKETIGDQDSSPDVPSDDLILGSNDENQDTVSDGSFLVISVDINGGIHVDMVAAEDENEALDQAQNEMLTQTMVIAEDSLMELISKLSQYVPEEINAENEPTKPPFIDQPDQTPIDEDEIEN